MAEDPQEAPSEVRYKLCPSCRAKIELAAQKCPHCHEWVRFRYAARRWLWIAVVAVVAWVVAGLLAQELQHSEMAFWRHPGSLAVTSKRSETQDGYQIVLVTVKNQSSRPWTYIMVQVDYYDKHDHLVDSGQSIMRETLAPQQERVCKVILGKTIPGADYDHCEAFVAGAYDASHRV